ncbi:ferrous iron transport protein A [Methanococcoides sp. SA1]|nr:ferrous iron transport protein A [Methanococcoides sp. SA1]
MAMLAEGDCAKVCKVRAGRGLLRRLVEMGFTENALVKMIKFDRGSLIVTVNGIRYALGKGMGMKIMVEPTSCEG